MRLLAAILALTLSGCAAIFGPDDWEPSGHMIVAGGMLGPINLYRPNPNEKPRMVKVAIAEGKTVDVEVWAYKCMNGSMDAVSLEYPKRAVWLCNRPEKEKHELAHQAGMKHTGWTLTGQGACATVTTAGYKTSYTVGKEICVVNNFELVSN